MYTLLFLGVCGSLLLLPFVPAWWEWRCPSDNRPLPVPPDADNDPNHFARRARIGQFPQVDSSDGDLCCTAGSRHRALLAHGRIEVHPGACILDWAHADGVIRLEEGSVGLRRLTAGEAIELAPDCCFERLHAPLVRFGAAPSSRRAIQPRDEPEQPWSALPGARPARVGCWRFDGDCDVPAGVRLRGSVVVTGVLRVGAGTVVCGDIKARGGMLLGADCRVEGAVSCESDIHLLCGASAAGPVISERTVFLGDSVRIGAPEALTTVSALSVVAQSGSQVHGTTWAHEMGVVWAPA